MKKLVTLMALAWTMLAPAQTADQFIQAGTNALTATNWWGAYTNFNAAQQASPANQDANVLLAATRLMVLPQTPAGSNFLVTLGFPKTNRWLPGVPLGSLPTNSYGDPAFPANYNSASVVSFFRTNILTAITNSLANLGAVTDPGYTLSLSSGETLIEPVTVDYGDIQMLRSMLGAAQVMIYTLNENNLSTVMPTIESWFENDTFTWQLALQNYPSLLTLQNTGDLPASKSALTNAIANYFAASAFIRNRSPSATERLFSLDASQTNDEAQFRATLTNVLASLNGPTEFDPGNIFSTINASNWFAGVVSVKSFLPKFNGDLYVLNTFTNYTLSGVLPYMPAYKMEELWRTHWPWHNYAGIYAGTVSDIYYGNYDAGSFAAFVNTNGQTTLVGFGYNGYGQAGGATAQFTVDSHGNWQFDSNSVAGVSGDGEIGDDGSFWGEVYFNNGDYIQLSGFQPALQSPLGPFQNAAGNYSGSWSGGGQTGPLKAVLSADGYIVFCTLDPQGGSDGGLGQLDSDGHFTTTSDNGATISGTLTNATLKIGGTFVSTDGSGTWSLSRSAYVPFDTPPVITKDLVTSTNIVLGTNVTFSLTVTGSAPLSYQWYFNGTDKSNAIPGAMASTLVVSNQLWLTTGSYTIFATVDNCAGGTNSQICQVNVTPETIPPTIAITNITPGMLVSNAAFTVMGRAFDNVAVSNVFVALSNSAVITPFAPAATTNWPGWTAPVTLSPGTNLVRAFAADSSGNVSVTTNARVVYVVSAMLTVQTNGRGSISPNDNGAMLAVGVNYSLTASPLAGSGFMFTNWTGGIGAPTAVLTNGPVLQFTMQNDLVLQANFVDTNKPVLAITNLVAGQRWSNSVFTVMGWATDNVAVASVYCSLSNAVESTGYGLAATANGWANWSTNLTLAPGTNMFSAYAVDINGNVSPTNNVSFQYVVSAPLQVQTAGLGTVSPNYSNAVLAVGQSFSMTATPGSGFVFTNWTGGTSLPLGWLTNGTTVKFMMQSDLTLQANFIDISKPTLSITNLASGQRVSNAVFIVKGKAGDNWQVSNVLCQINGGDWSSATNINNWTNWAAGVVLVPGTNNVAAYSVDTTGNLSTTNRLSFQYVVTNQLGLRASGLGTISPNYSNAWLNIGQNYSITATPGSGFIVTNWTISTNWLGAQITNKATVQFMMASNLTLQVNFADVTKPTLTVSSPTSGQHMTNALANLKGTASDNWKVAGVWYQLNGNAWALAATTNGFTNWTKTVTLAAGTNTFKIYALDLGGNYSTTNNLSVLSSNDFKLLLTFAAGQPLGTNGLNFVLQVSTNVSGHIQVSTNLLNWVSLTNFLGTNGTLNFRDPAATNYNSRYYRAVIP
jgi:hypothetical protein